jgi:hypothetical protein
MIHNGLTSIVIGLGSMLLLRAELPVRPPPDPSATPFQRQVLLRLAGREASATFTVPERTRLVIEYVSASAQVPFGQRLLIALETSVNGEAATHFLVPARPDFSRVTATDGDIVRLRQWMRAYADGGSEVTVLGSRTGQWGGGSARVTVTGFLFPLR